MKQKKIKIDPKEIGVPNICFSLSDSSMKDYEKHKKQRITRGFDNTELWNLDHTIAKFIYPRLKAFIDTGTHGYPSELIKQQEKIKDNSELDNEEYLVKRWNDILNEILWIFEILSDEDQEYEIERDLLNNNNKKEYKAYSTRRKKALQLFANYYSYLWD